MVATYVEKKYDFCDSGVYSREIISMFLVGQVSGPVDNTLTLGFS